jgi:TonB-linked SusC/RagA family outer membrane protein
MKLTSILILGACLQVSAKGISQTITFSEKNVSLQTVFSAIKKQTGYAVLYNADQLEKSRPVSINVTNVLLEDFLKQVLNGQPFEYTIENTTIFISFKAVPEAMAPKLVDTVHPEANESKVKLQGRVMDGADPLAGATIMVRKPGHSSASGVTDANGLFRIMSLAEGTYTLEVSFIGYEKNIREVTITDKLQMVFIAMKKSTSTLDAIQTTAYSKTSMRFSTGDVTTITSEEIARNPVPNVLEALQGRVPGMFVTQSSGKQNSAFQVQIRSLNTLSAAVGSTATITDPTPGGQPLYIVDGVEYPANGNLPTQALPGFVQPLGFGNALNYLDPSQIESINVLKGADATAIYGSRGAFGVILIATKKAKAGKPSLTINVQQGISIRGRSRKLLDLPQYLAWRHNALANDSVKPAATDYDINGTWDTTKATDWEKFFFGSHASTTRLNATWSGGSANSSYLVGGSYSAAGDIESSKGSVRQGGMNFSLNTATNNRKFTMALSGSYSTNRDNTVQVDFSRGGLTQAPNAPYPYLPDGKLDWSNGTNSAAALNLIYSNNTDNFIVNTNLTVMPVKGLSFSAVGGFNLLSAKEFEGEPSSYFNPATFTIAQTFSKVNFYRLRTLSADPRAEYIHTWGKARLNVIAGGSLRDLVSTTNVIAGSGFASDQLLMNPAAAPSANISVAYNVLPQRYIGGFAVINFRWADKYILDLNGRRDGSSVFGNNRQFGNFGSVAGAWIVSEEPWFKGLRPVVDFLKLKASYGLVGGSSIPPYSYISNYSASNNGYGGGSVLTPQRLANPYLHWETNKNFEVGLNIDLFKGRVNIDATYYTNKVGDQLTNQPLSSITGYRSFTVNSRAKIRSYGAEFAVVTKNIQNKDFSWTSKINLTIPRTRLLAFPGVDNLVNNFGYVIGKPITGVKLFQYAGVDPTTGNYTFYNAAGVKGEYSDFFGPRLNAVTDRDQFVDKAPKWYGGIVNTLNYKNLSMDFLITVTKRLGPNYLAFLAYTSPGGPNINIPADIADKRWMKKGDVATVAKASQSIAGALGLINFASSTGALSDATYARLQNLSISYRLPDRLVRKAHMSALTVYVSGQNLLTVSPYKGLDPENMLIQRIPPLRVFTGGIKAGF